MRIATHIESLSFPTLLGLGGEALVGYIVSSCFAGSAVTGQSGVFASGWYLSDVQLEYVLKTGTLGRSQ